MKTRIFLSLLIFFTSIFAFGQYSKKRLKEIDSEIEQAYQEGKYNRVIEWCGTLKLTDAKISPATFEYWLNSAYQLHDMNISLSLLELYEQELVVLRSYKKLSDETLAKLAKLHHIDSIYDRSILNQQSSKINAEQKKMVENMIAIDSTFWQPYMLLGNINYFQLDYPETIKAIKKVLQWQPDNVQALQEIGYSYFNVGDYKSSLFYLVQVEEPYDISTYLVTVAYANYHIEDYEQALWHCKEALKQPLNYQQKISCYSLKLNCERNLSMKKDEIETLYTFLALDTVKINESNVSYTYHLTKETLGFDESLNKARQHVKKYPANINYLLLKVYHYPYHNQAYYNEAISDFNRLVELDPTNYNFYMLQGRYLFNSEHSREQRALAKTAFEHAYQLDSSQYDVHEYMCRLFLWHDTKISKRYKKKAITNMTAKITKDPNNPIGYLDLAKAYDLPTSGYGNNNKYLDSMLKYYNKALVLGGDSFSVLVERRQVYSSLGMFEKSNADHSWIANHTKYSQTKKMCYYSIANNYMSLTQYENAKEVILKIRAEYPDDRATTSRWLKNISSKMEEQLEAEAAE